MEGELVPKQRQKERRADRKLRAISDTWITLGAYGLFDKHPGLEKSMLRILVQEMEEKVA